MADENNRKPHDQTMLNDESFEQQPFEDWAPLTTVPSERAEEELEVLNSRSKAAQEQRQTFDAEDFSSIAADRLQLPDSEDFEDDGEDRETQIPPQTVTAMSTKKLKSSPTILERLKSGNSKRIALILILSIALVGAGIGYWYQKKRSPAVTAFVRHPIPISSYKEQLSFLVVANVQNSKSLLSMAVTFEFHAANAHDQFRNNKIAIKDAVYQYLSQRQSSDNSADSWQKAISKDLLVDLKARFPRCRITSAQVTNLENL